FVFFSPFLPASKELLPATVVITPFVTLRMRLLLESAINRLPDASTARPLVWPSWAPAAGPLSPLKQHVPFPATVVITPLVTLRTRKLNASVMYRLPAESTATPWGLFSVALVEGPPSPLKPAVPLLPATVAITPFDTLRMRLFPLSAI